MLILYHPDSILVQHLSVELEYAKPLRSSDMEFPLDEFLATCNSYRYIFNLEMNYRS